MRRLGVNGIGRINRVAARIRMYAHSLDSEHRLATIWTVWQEKQVKQVKQEQVQKNEQEKHEQREWRVKPCASLSSLGPVRHLSWNIINPTNTNQTNQTNIIVDPMNAVVVCESGQVRLFSGRKGGLSSWSFRPGKGRVIAAWFASASGLSAGLSGLSTGLSGLSAGLSTSSTSSTSTSSGDRLVVVMHDGSVATVNVHDGRMATSVRGSPVHAVINAALCADAHAVLMLTSRNRLLLASLLSSTTSELPLFKSSSTSDQSSSDLGLKSSVTALACSPLKRNIAACGTADGSLLLLDTNHHHHQRSSSKNIPIKSFHRVHATAGIESIAFSPTQPLLISCSLDRSIVLYDVIALSSRVLTTLSSPLNVVTFLSPTVVAVSAVDASLFLLDIHHNGSILSSSSTNTSTSSTSATSASKSTSSHVADTTMACMDMFSPIAPPAKKSSTVVKKSDVVTVRRSLKHDLQEMAMFTPMDKENCGENKGEKSKVDYEKSKVDYEKSKVDSQKNKVESEKKKMESDSVKNNKQIELTKVSDEKVQPVVTKEKDVKAQVVTKEMDVKPEAVPDATIKALDVELKSNVKLDAAPEVKMASSVKLETTKVKLPTAVTSILSDMDTKIDSFSASMHSKITAQPAPDSSHPVSSDFQMTLITSALSDALVSFRTDMHHAIQNLHVEVLRQFDMQRSELEDTIREAVREGIRGGVESVVRALREE